MALPDSTRLPSRWRSWAATAIGLACAILFLSSVYQTYVAVQYPYTARAGSDGNAGAARQPYSDVHDIIKANLFNGVDNADSGAQDDGTSSLVLRGTFAGSDKTASFAIIAEAGQSEKNYRVGDHLSNGDEITKIDTDRITIQHGNAQHIVYLRALP